MTSKQQDSKYVVHSGRFLKIDSSKVNPDKRGTSDRRQTISGDPVRSQTGDERRIGSRRLEDVVITIKIKDEAQLYSNPIIFHKKAERFLDNEFKNLCTESEDDSLLTYASDNQHITVKTKLKHRDKIKRFALQTGLSFEVIDHGVYLGGTKTNDADTIADQQAGSKPETDEEKTELSSILGFPPDELVTELQNIKFKLFVKCLNEVHPIAGSHERDALKQNVQLEQQIIFMAKKHYPKSEKYSYKAIIEQVFAEVIKAYNEGIQLAAEMTKLEERFKLSNSSSLKKVIQAKREELEQIKNSSLTETVRTLYLYLEYFKDTIKTGAIKEQIETVFSKVNEKQISVLNLNETLPKLQSILEIEHTIKQQNTKKKGEHLGYMKWLKDEINREIYFTRHLWINNMKGKTYVADAISRTLKAVDQQTTDK